MPKEPIKVYISGQITGLTEDEFHQNFEEAQLLLQGHGFYTVNPLEVVPECKLDCGSESIFDDGRYQHTWQCYMKYDIKELLDCDALFAMDNATQSRGARLELEIARNLGLPIITSEDGKELEW